MTIFKKNIYFLCSQTSTETSGATSNPQVTKVSRGRRSWKSSSCQDHTWEFPPFNTQRRGGWWAGPQPSSASTSATGSEQELEWANGNQRWVMNLSPVSQLQFITLVSITFMMPSRECKQSTSSQAFSGHHRPGGGESYPDRETTAGPRAEREGGRRAQATRGAGKVCRLGCVSMCMRGSV